MSTTATSTTARPPRPVSNDNSRFMSAVTLLFSFSLAGPLARARHCPGITGGFTRSGGFTSRPRVAFPVRRCPRAGPWNRWKVPKKQAARGHSRNVRKGTAAIISNKIQNRHSWPFRDRFFFQINVIGSLSRGRILLKFLLNVRFTVQLIPDSS